MTTAKIAFILIFTLFFGLVASSVYFASSISNTKENLRTLSNKLDERLTNLDKRLEQTEIGIVTLVEEGYVEKPGLTTVASAVLSSIVFIVNAEDTSAYNEGSNVITTTPDDGIAGTGFFISTDGYVATARHVIENLSEDNIRIKDSQNRVYEASLVSVSDSTDVAVLKVRGEGFNAVEFGAFGNIRIGDAIGFLGFNPGFNHPLVSGGNVSTVGLDESGAKVFTINAFVNKGNSGSPVFSLLTGRVIGIVSSKKLERLSSKPLDLTNFSSGVSFGNVDPVKFSAEIYNETLKLVTEASQIGIGIIYSTDDIQSFGR